MATRPSSKRLAGKKPPAKVPDGLVTYEMVTKVEQELAQMQTFEQSGMWALQKKLLTARSDRLRHEREGMLRTLGKPDSKVTVSELMRVQGQIEENDSLLRFPRIALARWQNELEQMREVLSRPGGQA